MNSINIFSKEINSKGTKGYNKHTENSIFNNFNETQYFQKDDQDCITREKDKT